MPARKSKRLQWPRTLPPLAFDQGVFQHLIMPEETRGSVQQYLAARRRLCTNPVFLQSIKNLRDRYPLTYWKQAEKWRRVSCKLNDDMKKACFKILDRFWIKAGKAPVVPSLSLTVGGGLRFEGEARGLCDQCGLEARDIRWIEWLVRNWDPEAVELPPEEPIEIKPNFFPWRITVIDYLPLKHRRVVLVLEQGASQKAARRAADRAVKELPANCLRNAPSINDLEREQLHELFKKEIRKGKRAGQAYFKDLAERMTKEYWPISTATIRKEYYKFTGVRPRQYSGAASRDRRE